MALLASSAALAVAACGGATAGIDGSPGGSSGGVASSGSSGGGSSGTGLGGSSGSSGGRDASTDQGADGAALGRIPLLHRAAPVECTHVRAAGTADPQLSQACAADADCTAGTNGRCMVTVVAARLNYCSYDGCFTDAECGGKACTCRESPTDANRCGDGNCKVDADCGPGRYCSPSVAFDRINFGLSGYYCHTASDTCVDDADCSSSSANARCAYDPASARWACSTGMFLPP